MWRNLILINFKGDEAGLKLQKKKVKNYWGLLLVSINPETIKVNYQNIQDYYYYYYRLQICRGRLIINFSNECL
jgi:hypothetical protein